MINFEDLDCKLDGDVVVHFSLMSDLETMRVTAKVGDTEVGFRLLNDVSSFLHRFTTGNIKINLYSFGDVEQSVLKRVALIAQLSDADMFLYSVPYPQGITVDILDPRYIYDAQVRTWKERVAQLGEVPIAIDCHQKCYLPKKEMSHD